MDKGMIGLMSLAVVFVFTVALYGLGIVSSQVVSSLMGVCLSYHTVYTIYCIFKYKTRRRARNARRANCRPPGSKSSW